MPNALKIRETAMVKAIRVHQPGGVEALKYEEVSPEAPAPGECKSATAQLG